MLYKSQYLPTSFPRLFTTSVSTDENVSPAAHSCFCKAPTEETFIIETRRL